MITRKTLQTKIYKNTNVALTSAFGTSRPGGRTHVGEDWDSWPGESPRLYAPFNGVVTMIRNTLTDDRGKFIEIRIGTWYIFMQHLATISVKKGQRVAAGNLLAIQGGSGRTLGAYKSHLHIEFARYPFGDPRRKPLDPRVLFYPVFTAPKYPSKTVIVSDLNIRTDHSLAAEKHGIAKEQPYDIFDIVKEDEYVWGRIDWVLPLWIALKNEDGKQVFTK